MRLVKKMEETPKISLTYKLSEKSLERLKDIKPRLLEIVKAGITNSPYDFGIPKYGGFRTAEDQLILYKKGKSQKDGTKKKSYHQTGNAFDIFLFIDGKASWDKDKLEEVAKHLKKVAKEQFDEELFWGGDWDNDGIRVDHDPDEKFFDGAHFEIRKWKNL